MSPITGAVNGARAHGGVGQRQGGGVQPRAKFTTTADGVRIAYCAEGEGPALVFVRGWISHLEQMWQDAAFRAYFETLGSHFRVVRYDARGNGLSDWHVAGIELDALVADLEAVMDAAGVETATLYGQCFGGPIAVAFAARHPERVSRLILDGTYARGRAITSPERQAQMIKTMRELPEAGLALMSFYSHPDPQTQRFRQMGDRPNAIARDLVAELYELGFRIDVCELLGAIHVPTLVMHRERTRAIPARLGRELAAGITGARFVSLQGVEHNPWEGDAEEALAAIGEFVGAQLRPAGAGQATAGTTLRTILFTDMEDSTATTQRLGDAAAQQVVRAHNTAVRDALNQHGGHEIKHTGDGIMAWFASASGAVECAVAIQRALALAGTLRVRIGVNAGEPLAENDAHGHADLYGTAVQLAARLCAQAAPGEILASNVVRDLCAGKQIAFVDRGEAALKGFAAPVRLHAVGWEDSGA